MVTFEQLKKLYYAEPFKPFVIAHTDGRRVLISKTYQFSYSDVSKRVVFVQPGGIHWAPFEAVSIEPLKPNLTRKRKAS